MLGSNNSPWRQCLLMSFLFVMILVAFDGRTDGQELQFERRDFANEGQPQNMELADFNGDQSVDLVVAHFPTGGQSKVNVMLGSLDGQFGEPRDLPAPQNNQDSVNAADFDGDGHTDIAVLGNNGVLLHFGFGDGSFTKPQLVLSDADSINSGDLNGDGLLDLVVGGSEITVHLGLGDRNFAAGKTIDRGTIRGSAGDIEVVDLNRDGALDVITGNTFSNQEGSVSVLLGHGDGTFQDVDVYPAEGFTISVMTADLNGDGALDLVANNAGFVTISVFLGLGDGTFGPAKNIFVGQNPYDTVAADFNDDGNLDLAVTMLNGQSTIVVFLGLGDGTFGDGQFFATGVNPWSIRSSDFDQNGLPDVVVTNSSDNSITVLLNRFGALVGDINRDGLVDLLDTSPFVQLLTTGQYQFEADINQDGFVDLLDVQPFVYLLND